MPTKKPQALGPLNFKVIPILRAGVVIGPDPLSVYYTLY